MLRGHCRQEQDPGRVQCGLLCGASTGNNDGDDDDNDDDSLLQELVRAKASLREPLVAENCAFSLQEVLKVYEVNLEVRDPDTFTWRVWRQLSDFTQEKLTPLLSSMYAHESAVRADLPCPLFLSEFGRTYKNWLVNYCQFLMDLIKDGKTKRLFNACLPSMRRDLGIAESLLPRLVIEVLCCCGDDIIEKLLQEMLAIVDRDEDAPHHEDVLVSSVAGALASVLDHAGLWLRAKYQALIQVHMMIMMKIIMIMMMISHPGDSEDRGQAQTRGDPGGAQEESRVPQS